MKDELSKQTGWSRRWMIGVALGSSLLFHSTSRLLADSVFVGSLERKGVVIKAMHGEQLEFEINGRRTDLEISKITQLVADNEPVLNGAEEAYAAAKWDEAVDGYLKTIRTARKDWIKDWSAKRLIDAANKSGRFDAAVSAYIQTLLKDPTAAAALKPTMPESKSTYLDTAVRDVNTALRDPKLSTEQKRALLGFLVELQQARKDQPGEDAAYEQLARLPGADLNDPQAQRIHAKRRLSAASRAIEAKDFRKAIEEVSSAQDLISDAQQRTEALFILAEARYGLAGDDQTALKDAALAYMRVVATSRDEPSRPHVVPSLLATAEIMDRLGEPQTAQQLYEQIVAQYPDDPATIKARRQLREMSGGNEQPVTTN